MKLLELTNFKYKNNKLLSGLALVAMVYTLFSYVVSLSAFTSPSQDLRWNSVPYVNKVTYSPGQQVDISGELFEGEIYFSRGNYYFFTSSQDIVWIVNVMGPNNNPFYLTSDAIVGAQDDQVIGGVSFVLPVNAELGTYTVKLMVWSDWLPTGETRIHELGEITFEVV